jgi:hypothetical protein
MVVQIIYDIFIFTYYIMANFIHLNVVVWIMEEVSN